MNTFFKKIKRLERKHMHELAVMSGSVAMLLMLTVFVSSGLPSKVYAWVIYVYPVTYTPVTTGGYTTISWSAPTSDRCSIVGPTLPCITGVGSKVGGNGTYCYSTVNGASGSVYTGPINAPTTYTISCQNDSGGWGSSSAYGSNSITVYPTSAATTLTSFTANPTSIVGSGRSNLSWSGAKGTKFSSCQLTGGQWGSAGAWFTALPGNINTDVLTSTTNYSFKCFDTDGYSTSLKTATVTVTPAPVVDVCTDVAGTQSSVPSGCTGPTPAPSGACMPAGRTFNGTSCVVLSSPSCANGLASTYAPSCTCPSGQRQSGSLCVPNPVVTCANGLAGTYAPSCTCPSGQVQSGAACVLSGVINSLTANPSRVLRGRTSSISWSTSRMSSCSLQSLSASATTVVSSALTSSIVATIDNRTTYNLSCTDATGVSYTSSVTVSLIPQTIEQ